jgi:hypothetical protein
MDDFIQALRMLGAGLPNASMLCEHGDPGSREIQRIFLSCPLRTWTRVFGEPESVIDHCEDVANMPLQTWEHECRDGTILCIGHLFERVPAEPWVILARVCLA